MSNNLLLNTISWMRQAGAIQLEYFRTPGLVVTAKDNRSDIVTEVDRRTEEFLKEKICSHYPHHSILAEENGNYGDQHSEYRWIIDPLDGTTNFKAGLPYFSISIAIEHNGEPYIGIVYAPSLSEMFHAVKGEGAFLNGKQIQVTSNSELADAVVVTGFPIDKDTNPDNNLDNVGRVLPKVRGLRRFGSAALDLCYVAAGITDAFWEMNLHDWDIAAGQIIAEEAGAKVESFRIGRNNSIIAAPPELFKKISMLII